MKQIRSLAGMAVFAFGVLATSSCSKDEFFGLNEFESLDYSKKTEIALSQEYTDYAVACYKIVDAMNQLSDTSSNLNKGEIEGKNVRYFESGEPIMDLLDILKKAYPELINADKPDFDEIQRIAISKNETIKNIAGSKNKTKWDGYYYDSEYFIGNLNCALSNYWTDNPFTMTAQVGKWFLESCWDQGSAVSEAIWFSSEFGNQLGSGGLLFPDYSAACVVGIGEWPSIINSVSSAEADFLIVPYSNISYMEALSIGSITGGSRTHYFVHRNGEVIGFI